MHPAIAAALLALLPQDSALELEPFVDVAGHDTLRGVFRVPENRALEGGRTLELDVLVLSATGEAAPDAILVLAGGPGQAATRTSGAWLRHPLRVRHDLVFVDQRGTGGEHALRCEGTASGRGP
jgi:pimeloyl-ACP methyl ester carboxylesterase